MSYYLVCFTREKNLGLKPKNYPPTLNNRRNKERIGLANFEYQKVKPKS